MAERRGYVLPGPGRLRGPLGGGGEQARGLGARTALRHMPPRAGVTGSCAPLPPAVLVLPETREAPACLRIFGIDKRRAPVEDHTVIHQ